MADVVGVKQQNWARWESGTVTPSAEMIMTICQKHNCSADWLLGLKDLKFTAADYKQDAPQKTPVVNLDELRATATQLAEESAALAGTIKKLKKML